MNKRKVVSVVSLSESKGRRQLTQPLPVSNERYIGVTMTQSPTVFLSVSR